MKRPVIATAIGGSLDQVEDGQTGFLVPPGDPAALAEKIAVLLQDPQRRKSMGDAGRQRLERLFSIETMISRFEGVYRDLTGIK